MEDNVIFLYRNSSGHFHTSKDFISQRIPTIVFKNLNPNLSPILAMLFYLCLKEKCSQSIRKVLAVCQFYEDAKYHIISRLSISKQESCWSHDRNNPLSTKQYLFDSSSSIADILTIIKHTIIEALHNEFNSSEISQRLLTKSGIDMRLL